MPWVQRNASHVIIGCYNNKQPGIAEEYLADDDPEVIAFYNPPKIVIPTTDFIARFTNAEYLGVGKQRAADIAANKVGYSKNWDVVVTADTINLTSQKTQRIKQDLIDAGVLTQARADEIFGSPA